VTPEFLPDRNLWNQPVDVFGTARPRLAGSGSGRQGGCGGEGHFPDNDYQTNFIECIRSRKLPHGDQGHQSASVVHMGNIAHRMGNQRVAFDAATESCPGNAAANSMLRSAYRKHYRIPDSV
jgi:hypothetical protein